MKRFTIIYMIALCTGILLYAGCRRKKKYSAWVFPCKIATHDDGNSPGEVIFKSNCASCHYTSEQQLVGPGLKGIEKRVHLEKMMQWMYQPDSMVVHDPYFRELYVAHHEMKHPVFINLNQQDQKDLVEYIWKYNYTHTYQERVIGCP